jgi:hypothetical protein
MSSNIISEDVLNKICNALERSSFGSGDMIAGILADPDFQMPVVNGIWDIELVEEDGDHYYYYSKRRDSYMGGPSWQTRISFSINIKTETIEFLLGCGVHSASCVFSRRTGDLLEVIPDGSPSDCFWGDGDHPDLPLRAKREFSLMAAPVHSEHA